MYSSIILTYVVTYTEALNCLYSEAVITYTVTLNFLDSDSSSKLI